MELRQFGITALYVAPVVFGAWQIGGPPFFKPVEEKDAVKLIQGCRDFGINFFDTAPVYGFGRSEEFVGKAVKSFRTEVIISTKCGLKWKDDTVEGIYKHASKDSIKKEVELSLKRLQTDYIDLYLVHWPDDSTPIGETVEALNELKRSGKIRFYGLSNFSKAQMEEAKANGADISGLQSQYSMLKTDLESGGELDYCVKNEIGFQAYSPLHRGILTDRSIDALKGTGQLAIDWILNSIDEKQIEKVKKIKELSSSLGVSLSTFVINWTLMQPGVTTAIVGTTKLENIKEAAGALSLKLPEAALDAVRGI